MRPTPSVSKRNIQLCVWQKGRILTYPTVHANVWPVGSNLQLTKARTRRPRRQSTHTAYSRTYTLHAGRLLNHKTVGCKLGNGTLRTSSVTPIHEGIVFRQSRELAPAVVCETARTQPVPLAGTRQGCYPVHDAVVTLLR